MSKVRSIRIGASAAVWCAVLLPLLAWGATWTVNKSPNPTVYDNMLFGADAFSSTNAWAVGRADTGTLPALRKPVILRWDGRKWKMSQSPVPTNGGELRDVDTLSATSAWAVGFTNTGGGFGTLTQRWNGSSWSTVTSPNRPGAAQNVLLAVKAFGANEVWTVGYNNIPNTLAFETMVQRWDGAAWSIVPSPNPDPFESQLFALDGTSPTDIWAVGLTHADPDGVRSPMAMHWDGVSWEVASLPVTRDCGLEGVVAIAPDDVWAVGWNFSFPLLWHVPFALHYDGSTWTSIPIPQSSPQGGMLFDVTALGPDKVYVVGHTNMSSLPTLVMRWDGSMWTTEPAPDPNAVSYLWDATPFGASDLLFVGSTAKMIGQNVGPHKTLIVKATGG